VLLSAWLCCTQLSSSPSSLSLWGSPGMLSVYQVGRDLTGADAECLQRFGWTPGMGLGALLNYRGAHVSRAQGPPRPFSPWHRPRMVPARRRRAGPGPGAAPGAAPEPGASHPAPAGAPQGATGGETPREWQ